jgi:hypothetical protein
MGWVQTIKLLLFIEFRLGNIKWCGKSNKGGVFYQYVTNLKERKPYHRIEYHEERFVVKQTFTTGSG